MTSEGSEEFKIAKKLKGYIKIKLVFDEAWTTAGVLLVLLLSNVKIDVEVKSEMNKQIQNNKILFIDLK